MLSRLRIRTRLALVMAVPLVAVVGVAILGFQTMQAVKVDGPSYDEIVQAQELVQDVVAPPEFLIESFLVVRQLSTETDEQQIALLSNRLGDLRTVYETRHQYWQDQQIEDPSIRFALLSDSYAPAQEFWTVVTEDFLPAVNDGDRRAAMALAEGPLQSAYERHRDAVSRVVRLATEQQVEVEAATSSWIDRRTDLLIAVVALVAVIAVALAYLVVRSIRRPLRALERDLPRVADELHHLDLTEEAPELHLSEATGNDELANATNAFNSVVRTAVDLAAEQARIQREVSETYLHLGRRNQNLLRRMLSFVTDLEQNERDAEALDHLFRLDHLATRMRRNAESLLVLAGAEPARTWSEPVPMLEVVRAAISEIEDFSRVQLAVMEPAAVVGTAASDVTHLLAELLENAALFSPPTAPVMVHGRRREDGYLLSIVDHGIGMTDEQLAGAHERLAGGEGSPAKMLGLHVVGRLAARHDLRVQLAANPSGGTVAIVWLPFGLVGPVPTSAPAAAPVEAAVDREPAMAGAGGHEASQGATTSSVRLPTLAPPERRPVPSPTSPSTVASNQPPRPPSVSGGEPGLRPRPRPEGNRANGVATPLRVTTPDAGPRSPEQVRNNLARLQAGVRQARHDSPAPGEGGRP